MKYASGIYKIRNILNNHYYIGQSINLNKRKYTHFSLLRNNKHSNRYLQSAFNKYGENNFVFEIILYCESKELIYYEQSFIDKWDSKYNIWKECVTSPLGIKRSLETIQKMKNTLKNNGIPTNMYTEQYVLQILEMIYTNASNYDIRMHFYISQPIIDKIKRNGYKDRYGITYDKQKINTT